MTSEHNIPSVELIAKDLRVIVRDGIQRFSVESLKALPALDGLRPQAGDSANVLSVKTALLRHVVHLQPDWKRRSALALFGSTSETDSMDLPARRDAAGGLWNPPVAGNTFRATDNGESRIVSELAAALQLDEIHNQRHAVEGERLIGQIRSRISIEFEQRLGYRWVSYRRVVRWDETANAWLNRLSLEIEALRSGTRIVEYDYIGSRLVIVGKPIIEPVDKLHQPSYLSSVDSDFYSHGYLRARFDLGRELFADERVALTFSYYLAQLSPSEPINPSFGLVSPFDGMELIELAFEPSHPERSWVFAYRQSHLGAIVERQWGSTVAEDRGDDGSYKGAFTARFFTPFAGVTYILELVEMEGNVRKILAEHATT
jgi:hypothetical protein